jgi:hypothetical protein
MEQEEIYEEQVVKKCPPSCGTVFASGSYPETNEQSLTV